MRWFANITNSMGMNSSELQETVKDRGAWHAIVHGVAESGTHLGATLKGHPELSIQINKTLMWYIFF